MISPLILNTTPVFAPSDPADPSFAFITACFGDFDTVRELTFKHPDCLMQSIEGESFPYRTKSLGFELACTYGSLEIARFLSTNPELQSCQPAFAHLPIHPDYSFRGFKDACMHGQLNIVEFLTSTEWHHCGHPLFDIHGQQDESFLLACQEGHLSIVRWLTTSPQMLNSGLSFVDLSSCGHEALHRAGLGGHVDIIRFLTTSPDLLEAGHALVDLDAHQDSLFFWACERGDLEMAQYLSLHRGSSSAEHPPLNIHAHEEWAFRSACENGHLDLVKFLTDSLELTKQGYTLVDVNPPILEASFIHALDLGRHSVLQWCLMHLPSDRALRPSPGSALEQSLLLYDWYQAYREHHQFSQSLHTQSSLDRPHLQQASLPWRVSHSPLRL